MPLHQKINQLITDLESGKVLHFTNLEFPVSEIEQQYFTSEIRDKKSRNIRATCKIH